LPELTGDCMIIIHDHKNLDALIEAFRLHPTEYLRQKLIDLEIDYLGNYVGFQEANYLWHKIAA